MEMVLMVPILMALMFGAYQLARIFYTYHSLQKAFRGGAGMLAHASGVNYCLGTADPTVANALNFIVYGNFTPGGTPVVQGLTTDMINVVAERIPTGSTSPGPCPCDTGGLSGDPDSCDIGNGGRAPDFVVVNDLAVYPLGFPLTVVFPFVPADVAGFPINLNVSVRMAVSGD